MSCMTRMIAFVCLDKNGQMDRQLQCAKFNGLQLTITKCFFIFTSFVKEVVFGSAGLFVCLLAHYSKRYEHRAMKFYGRVQGGKRNN